MSNTKKGAAAYEINKLSSAHIFKLCMWLQQNYEYEKAQPLDSTAQRATGALGWPVTGSNVKHAYKVAELEHVYRLIPRPADVRYDLLRQQVVSISDQLGIEVPPELRA